MPESLSIGAFVFGAILVLAALVGGEFKLFGAEVNAKLDRSVRAVSFLLGILLLGWALLGGEFMQNGPPKPRTTDATEAPVTPAGTDKGADTPKPPAIANLAGEWVDNHGGTHQIKQRGEQLRFTGYNPGADVRSQGTGRVTGEQVTWDFQTDIPSEGTVNMRLAPDHNSASGVVEDSAEGRYAIVLTRSP